MLRNLRYLLVANNVQKLDFIGISESYFLNVFVIYSFRLLNVLLLFLYSCVCVFNSGYPHFVSFIREYNKKALHLEGFLQLTME